MRKLLVFIVALATFALIASPDISHYLCTVEHVCATICLVFCRRATLWRRTTRELLGLSGNEDVVSVGLGMMPQLLRVAAARVRRASRVRLPRR